MTLAVQPQPASDIPLPAEPAPGSIAHLKESFEARSTMPNALLVIWVENALNSDDAKDKWLEQFQVRAAVAGHLRARQRHGAHWRQ